MRGVEGTFPNGNAGYMWAQGQVVWENGALLSITDGLGYPDQAAGSKLEHQNHYRWVFDNEPEWEKAIEVAVPLQYSNIKEVLIKAMYTQDEVFIRVRWHPAIS